MLSWTTSLCHLHYIFVPPAVKHLLPSLIYSKFLLHALSLSFLLLLLITSQPLSLSCCILCPSLLSCLVLLTETEARGHPRDPCVYLCGGKEKAEEDLPAWTGRAPCCEPGRGREGSRGGRERGREAGEVLPSCGAQAMPWWDRDNCCLEPWWHSAPEALGTCLLWGRTVQQWGTSALWGHRSRHGCKEKIFSWWRKHCPPPFTFLCKHIFFPFPMLHVFGVSALEFDYLGQSSGCLRSSWMSP